jgi:hypothetical protein
MLAWCTYPCPGHMHLRTSKGDASSASLPQLSKIQVFLDHYKINHADSRSSLTTTSSTPPAKFHGVPTTTLLRSPKRSKLHQPCKCNHDYTTCRSTPTRRTTRAGEADDPALLHRLMDRRGHHADAIYIYTNTQAWRHEAKIEDDDHSSRIGGTL